MPSPPQATSSSAPPSSALRTCAGALRLFGTSHQNGSAIPAASRTRRSSGSPPPSVLPACAITATFTTSSSVVARVRGRAGGPADEDEDNDRDDSEDDPACHVERVVHAAIGT